MQDEEEQEEQQIRHDQYTNFVGRGKKRNFVVTESPNTPEHVLLLHGASKRDENQIASMLKELGWQIYDHLYPFRLAAQHIRHNTERKEELAQFLAEKVCDGYHSDKKDYVFYSFLKWCKRHHSDLPNVLVLGIRGSADIETFRANGGRVVNYQCDIPSDLVITDVCFGEVQRVSKTMQSTHFFALREQYQMQFNRIQNKRKQF